MVPAGTITLNANGTYTYVPAAGFTGTVPVVYTATDNNVMPATDSATLTIEVTKDTPDVNDPPLAQDDTASTEAGTPVSGERAAERQRPGRRPDPRDRGDRGHGRRRAGG